MGSRRITLLIGAAAAAVVLGGAAAFACTNLATIGTSATSAKAGGVVTITGSSFAAPSEGEAPAPVAVRWNKVDGPVLTTLTPDAGGAVSGSFTLPDASPGHYVVIATQVDDEGEPQFGTPARVAFEILSPSGASAAPAPATANTTSSSSSSSDSSVPMALLVMAGVVAVGAVAAGLASFRGTASRRPAPAVAVTDTPAEPEREPAGK
ncbi:MAG: hypothetical protein ACRD0N_05035 [Acidimicrobiales bacterium]